MKKMIFLVFIALVGVVFLNSCQKEMVSPEEITRTCEKDEPLTSKQATFRFGTITQNGIVDSRSFSSYDVIVISINPLKIISSELEVRTVINKGTGLISSVIVEKSGGGSIEAGYWFDGNDCFVYGTIFTGDDGTSLFVASSLETQYIMNECGYSNMA